MIFKEEQVGGRPWMKNVCCDKVEQKSSRGDIEVGGLREPIKLEKGVYI